MRNELCHKVIMTINGLLIVSLSSLVGCVPVMVAGAVGGATSVATSAAEERGVKGVLSDKEIAFRVRSRLVDTDAILADNVSILVRERRVLLTGTVENQKMQIDAVRCAWEVESVKDVIDETVLGPEKSIGQSAKDQWLSSQLKTKLLFANDVSSINYDYTVNEGVIYLIGIAQNQQEVNDVVEIARNIGGVNRVVNYITLKPADVNSMPMQAPQWSTQQQPVMHDDDASGYQDVTPVNSNGYMQSRYGPVQPSPYSSPQSLQRPNTASSFD